jgi:hypothetical protein
MPGIYKLTTADGIVTAKNVITDAGKVSILNAVAGKSTGFAASLVAGIGSVAASTSDTELQYAVGGNDINAIIVDLANEKIFFKASLPAADNYEIHELGCFSTNYTGAQNAFGAGSITLVVFGENTAWTDTVGVSTLASTNNRIGTSSIQYASFSTAAGQMAFQQDLAGLPNAATFDLAYYANGLSDLVVRFKFDATNYFECNTWPITNGYNIAKIAKSDFTTIGIPDWASISVLEIEATGTTATLSLDALRYTVPIVSEAINSSLLSRVVLDTPQQKLAGISMDIEYMLELDI